MFSERGFKYIRNISIALHKNDLIQHSLMGLDGDTWHEGYYDTTEPERERFAVDGYHQDAYEHGNLIGELLCEFDRSDDEVGIQYVELDITHAYCPIGCHRPFDAWDISWLYAFKPAAIDILGAQNDEDKELFMEAFRESINEVTTDERKLDAFFQDTLIKFRPAPSKRWNRWKCATVQR